MNPAPLKYWAFISYSHRDARVAKALQRAIETFRVPKRLVGTRRPAGEIPSQLNPIFLDRDELPAGTDLQTIVREALTQSRFLIVVCSPDAARSLWVNQEIIEFKKMHGGSRVLAVIASGEPLASRLAGREAEECFPPALRLELTASGVADGAPLEPIAADLRAHADGRRRGTLKLIAGMLGVGADELIQRDARRRMRQLMAIAAASLAGMAVMSGLAISAVRSRDEATLQRGEAEELLEFMLGDLRKKLVPVGRLDVLDGVGEKALAYYSRQDAGRLDAGSLGRRSRAFHVIGEMREARGDLGAAQVAFERAAATTAKLLSRAPYDGQRIFDHAQSVYWMGYLAWRRAQTAAAEKAFRHYVELAAQLARIDSQNLDWLAETCYAHVNVGVVCLYTNRLPEAIDAFNQARATWDRIIPSKPARALDLANCIGWIAKTYDVQGQFQRASDAQREKLRVLDLMPNAETNQQVSRHHRTTFYELARLELAMGRVTNAHQFVVTAIESGKALVALDPENKSWLEQLYHLQTLLGETQAALGNLAGARETYELVARGAAELLARDPKVADWQVNLRGRVLALGAQVARADERAGLIAELQQYLVKVREFSTADRLLTQGRDLIVGRAEAMLGVLLACDARAKKAATHWRAAAVRVRPYAETGDLPALTLLAITHARLGELAEARTLAQRVESSGYRHPAYTELVQLLAGSAGSSLAP